VSRWHDAPLSCVLVHLSGPVLNAAVRIVSFTQRPTATWLGSALKKSMRSVPRFTQQRVGLGRSIESHPLSELQVVLH
jgi:hypothetical protein